MSRHRRPGGGRSYSGTLTATLPSSLADGTYQVIVVTDSGDAVATDPNRANNQSSAPQPLTFGHVDLVPSITTAPTAATSGTRSDGDVVHDQQRHRADA